MKTDNEKSETDVIPNLIGNRSLPVASRLIREYCGENSLFELPVGHLIENVGQRIWLKPPAIAPNRNELSTVTDPNPGVATTEYSSPRPCTRLCHTYWFILALSNNNHPWYDGGSNTTLGLTSSPMDQAKRDENRKSSGEQPFLRIHCLHSMAYCICIVYINQWHRIEHSWLLTSDWA